MIKSAYVSFCYGGREKYEYFSNVIGLYNDEYNALISTLNYLIDNRYIDFELHYDEYLKNYFKDTIKENILDSESESENESESESEEKLDRQNFLKKEYKNFSDSDSESELQNKLDKNEKYILEEYRKYKTMLGELKEIFDSKPYKSYAEHKENKEKYKDLYNKHINEFKLYLKTKVNSMKDLEKLCDSYGDSYYGEGWEFKIEKIKIE